METIQPVMKRGRDYWDKINMPVSEFRGRVTKIKREMKKEEIDVLLLYGFGINEYGNSCYLSNHVLSMPWGELVVIPQNGEVALIFAGGARGIPALKSTTWIEDLKPSENIARGCIEYLKEKNLIPSTIGCVGLRQLMPYAQWQLLHESLGRCRIVDSDHIIRNMRMVKSPRECDQIRRASRILTNAFDLVADTTYSNMNERIIEAVAERAAHLEGAEDFRMLIARPREENWTLRPAEEARVSSGDSVIIYLAVEYERYWSEGIRTFKVDSQHLVQSELKHLEVSYQQIINRMKPGKTLSQFYREIIADLQRNGIDFIPEYGLGQGIGLSLQEFPLIAEEDTSQLQEGMCLTLRLLTNDSEAGAVGTGDTICILKDCVEVLTI